MGPRVVRVVVAIISLAVGVIFVFLPLPEVPFFFLSGALLAAESAPLARLLDRTELLARRWIKGVRDKWRPMPMLFKGILGVLFLSAAVGELYLLCRVCSN